ncbi:MAG: hypothetical protein NWF08_09910 [Candidatus Bathyarchaeota archaeon]|nr:hypothetical protein [Candidatus Bathyarchaeota archaeon]
MLVNDYLLGFLSGVGATIFGFILTMSWEIWRDRKRESKEKQKVIGNLLTELKENLRIIELNKELCNKNIAIAKEKRQVIGSPIFLHNSAWDLVKISGFLSRLKYKQLKEIEENYHLIEVLNTQIGIRENSRTLYPPKHLADVDKILLVLMEGLDKQILKILSNLKKINQK